MKFDLYNNYYITIVINISFQMLPRNISLYTKHQTNIKKDLVT